MDMEGRGSPPWGASEAWLGCIRESDLAWRKVRLKELTSKVAFGWPWVWVMDMRTDKMRWVRVRDNEISSVTHV
jgi:hypothetical protein